MEQLPYYTLVPGIVAPSRTLTGPWATYNYAVIIIMSSTGSNDFGRNDANSEVSSFPI